MVKANWDTEELIEHWTLLPQELELVKNKVGANQIGFAILLKFFQTFARFPTNSGEIPNAIISYIAQQLQIPSSDYSDYDWQGRSISNHRAAIRKLFGFRTVKVVDEEEMVDWLKAKIIPNEQRIELIRELVYQKFQELQIEPPTKGRVERLVKGAIAQYEADFCQQTLKKLTPPIIQKIDILLSTENTEETEDDESASGSSQKIKMSDFAFLKTDPGAVGLDSFLTEIKKLKLIRAVGLPSDLFTGISEKLVKTYRQRASTESPYDLRRHKDAIRYTLMAAFCIQRSQEITDNLIELLNQIIHRIDTRAVRRINQELIDEFKTVSGKTGLLFRIAEAAIAAPQGVVEQVIYPVVSLKTLKDLVAEYKSALRLGTAETEAILKRFRKNSVQHPTYQALMELGRVIKTIFLCQYLDSEELRREINEGLNVVERWNGVNDFIFYGKGGEFADNRLENQELSVLSLHLLQICLVYINTLMIQSVLATSHWEKRLTARDLQAITPLIFSHVNPYGLFKLDMKERISRLSQPLVA